MLTGEIRNQVNQIWDAFWSGGVSNPLSVIEQITYLLFIKRLDDLHTLEENKAETLGTEMERRIFPEGNDERGRAYEDLRWSRFKNFEPREMMEVVADHVFPFLRTLGEEGSSYGARMKDARIGFSNAALLAKTVEMLHKIPMDDRDTKGDLYEYMLGKIATAGQNGQFRTPRHIIKLMVELTKPAPGDVICDPAAGTCGFLIAAGEYLREHHAGLFRDEKQRKHFHKDLFHGFDFDPTMLRIGAMNMTLHGVENADVSYRDSLAEDHSGDAGRYSLVLANPPFAGSLDYESTAKDLQRIVKTKKTELLFLALFLRLLKTGGRAAVIVPDGVLFGSSKAHKELRRMLVEDHKLDAVIKLPSGVFRPYAGVSTAVLLWRLLCEVHTTGTTAHLVFDLLEYIKQLGGTSCKLRESVSALKCIVEEHRELGTDLKTLYADEIGKRKFKSRSNVYRCIGSTLLVKGLEFDHSVILRGTDWQRSWGNHKDLYVALTRGSKTTTLMELTN